MKRWSFFAFGVACHLMFLGVYAYLAGFVGNFVVPKSIDTPTSTPTGAAVTIDLLLLALFAVQHSVMARPGFKKVWTRVVPEPIERATYVLVANLVTIVLIWQWRSIDATIWNVEQPVPRTALWALFVLGWLM